MPDQDKKPSTSIAVIGIPGLPDALRAIGHAVIGDNLAEEDSVKAAIKAAVFAQSDMKYVAIVAGTSKSLRDWVQIKAAQKRPVVILTSDSIPFGEPIEWTKTVQLPATVNQILTTIKAPENHTGLGDLTIDANGVLEVVPSDEAPSEPDDTDDPFASDLFHAPDEQEPEGPEAADESDDSDMLPPPQTLITPTPSPVTPVIDAPAPAAPFVLPAGLTPTPSPVEPVIGIPTPEAPEQPVATPQQASSIPGLVPTPSPVAPVIPERQPLSVPEQTPSIPGLVPTPSPVEPVIPIAPVQPHVPEPQPPVEPPVVEPPVAPPAPVRAPLVRSVPQPESAPVSPERRASLDRLPPPVPHASAPAPAAADDEDGIDRFYAVPAQRSTSPRPLGQVIVVWAAKGGVGKGALAATLAEEAARSAYRKEDGKRVILIDANRGQGDIRKSLRLKNDLPSAYDAAVHGDPKYAVTTPKRLNASRSGNLDALNIGVMLAPLPDQSDPSIVTTQVYADMIDYARSNADLVVIDTQIAESFDTSGLIDHVVIPLLATGGAWGVGITDSSRQGIDNMRERLRMFQHKGVSRERMLLCMNRSSPESGMSTESFAEAVAKYGTWVGVSPVDFKVERAFEIGSIPGGPGAPSTPDFMRLINRVLWRVTGLAVFDDDAINALAPHRSRGMTGPSTIGVRGGNGVLDSVRGVFSRRKK